MVPRTCKSADSCDFRSFGCSTLHRFFFLAPANEMNNNFRIREETKMMSSPTHANESSDFILSPQQMQGSSYPESMPTAEWTDEKHSMYLKSIEASFVDQLYDFKQNLGCFSPVRTSSDSATTSGKFKVLRGDIWQKKSFVTENPQRSRINEWPDLKANSWIQHYRSSCKQPSLEAPVVGAEMSDQNFADEVVEGEKENNTRDVKRLKSL